MSYCSKCGARTHPDAVICLGCGCAVQASPGVNPGISRGGLFLICLLFGVFGMHRFVVGKIGTGILYFLTVGLFGFGVLYDLVVILVGSFKDKNGNLIA